MKGDAASVVKSWKASTNGPYFVSTLDVCVYCSIISETRIW